MENSNAQYWLSRAGREYQWQQQERTALGNPSYLQQERWLTRRFAELAAKLGRPVQALEFGCGFGRFARLYASNPDVVYHGYDFSQTMVQPLLDSPPIELAPMDSRVKVAPTVTEAFNSKQFDVIFTVSVLIHNSPENSAALCKVLASMLSEGGELWLIENALVSLSMRENNWHGGCWVHDFAGTTAPNMDLHVFHHVIQNHGAYVLKRPVGSRCIQLSAGEDSPPRASSLDELRLLGLTRLHSAIAGLEAELASQADLQGAVHDQSETIASLQKDTTILHGAVKDALEALAPDIALSENQGTRPAEVLGQALRETARNVGETARSLASVQELRANIADALATANVPPPPSRVNYVRAGVEEAPAPPPAAPFDWNSDKDTALSNPHEGFDRVCHVFNREWIGIRAAAGALPGNKLAISATKHMSAFEVAQVSDLLRRHGVTKLAFQGMSEPLHALILALARTGQFEMHLVWHGAPAMWMMEHERKLVGSALDLVKKGILKKINIMRRGAEPLIGERAYTKLLLNMPPNVRIAAALELAGKKRANGQRIAFIPSWHLLHKNVASCTLAAHVTQKITDIWLLDEKVARQLDYNEKVKILGPRHGRAMLETMREADLVINASLIDCHPMVDLEALAVGTPCVRGPLFLDGLESHEYVKLTETKNVLSIADLSATMTNVLSVPDVEISEMMKDYRRQLIELSAERYRDFLEL